MKHQRTLYLKRVSKENAKAKAKSPPVVDDAASTASIESHVSLPVVILPLDPQSVDADDNLCNLGNIQMLIMSLKFSLNQRSHHLPSTSLHLEF